MFPRTCKQCGEEKEETGFYKHPFSRGGRSEKCKECVKENVRANRLKRLEYYREYDRQRMDQPERVEARRNYRERNKASYLERSKTWQQANREKRAAHIMVGNAVRAGKILKPSACQRCGEASVKLDGHHEDYAKPLDVTWLCEPCHGARHREINAEKRKSA